MEKLDVIIIGSGTAGLSALREVQKQTDKFVLINSGDWGTTCAARGCMPSKALIEAVHAYHRRLDFVDLSRQGRARTAETAEGLIEVYVDSASGRLTGAEMCAPDGEHLAHLLALAIQSGLTVGDMLAMPFCHPVLEEGLRTALRDVARKMANDSGSDLANCPPLGIAALE